jgi:hypothetical protein
MICRTSLISTLLACAVLSGADSSPVPSRALNAITAEGVLKHIRVLASDDFEGRAPGTPGEQKSLGYIIEQCKSLKLAPGNPNGTWLEPVALWGITSGGGEITMKSGDLDFPVTAQDYRVTSSQPKTSIDVANSPIVFVGYGIVAPEYKWDDYKCIDVKGKAVVILAGDPPIPDPADPTKLDPKMFLGPELSMYGRPGSKADMAYARGAAVVITLQGAGGAGRGAARGGAGVGANRFIVRESMIVRDASSTEHIAATVSLNNDKATQLFAASGQDLATLRESALSRDFQPVTLRASIAVRAKNEVREISSANVVAKVEGSDPKFRQEYVIYSGHWDHLGDAKAITSFMAPATTLLASPACWN